MYSTQQGLAPEKRRQDISRFKKRNWGKKKKKKKLGTERDTGAPESTSIHYRGPISLSIHSAPIIKSNKLLERVAISKKRSGWNKKKKKRKMREPGPPDAPESTLQSASSNRFPSFNRI